MYIYIYLFMFMILPRLQILFLDPRVQGATTDSSVTISCVQPRARIQECAQARLCANRIVCAIKFFSSEGRQTCKV